MVLDSLIESQRVELKDKLRAELAEEAGIGQDDAKVVKLE